VIGHHRLDEGDLLQPEHRQLGGGNVMNVERRAGNEIGRAVMGLDVHGLSFQPLGAAYPAQGPSVV
jgi:hypothetical protein